MTSLSLSEMCEVLMLQEIGRTLVYSYVSAFFYMKDVYNSKHFNFSLFSERETLSPCKLIFSECKMTL